MRCLLVDPNSESVAQLAFALESHPTVSTVQTAVDVTTALALIKRQAVDALFVSLANFTATDREAFRQAPWRPAIIGVSDRPEDAVIAYDLDAVDFLLKPLTQSKVARAVGKLNRCSACNAPQHSTLRVSVQRGEQLAYLDARDIHFIETDGDYTKIVTAAGVDNCRLSLSALQERLAPLGFVRIHRRWLVSPAQVVSLHTEAGRLYVRVAEQDLPVSRRALAEVRARFN